jgi:hypothetical protein
MATSLQKQRFIPLHNDLLEINATSIPHLNESRHHEEGGACLEIAVKLQIKAVYKCGSCDEVHAHGDA